MMRPIQPYLELSPKNLVSYTDMLRECAQQGTNNFLVAEQLVRYSFANSHDSIDDVYEQPDGGDWAVIVSDTFVSEIRDIVSDLGLNSTVAAYCSEDCPVIQRVGADSTKVYHSDVLGCQVIIQELLGSDGTFMVWAHRDAGWELIICIRTVELEINTFQGAKDLNGVLHSESIEGLDTNKAVCAIGVSTLPSDLQIRVLDNNDEDTGLEVYLTYGAEARNRPFGNRFTPELLELNPDMDQTPDRYIVYAEFDPSTLTPGITYSLQVISGEEDRNIEFEIPE